MAEYPHLPLFTDAYIADTMHLSVAQSGAYLHLLMAMWRTPECRLENDDEKLCRMARCTRREWRNVRDAVMPFFDQKDGYLTQKRLVRVRESVREKSQHAKRAAEVRWLKNNKTDDADALIEHGNGQCSGDASKSISKRDVLRTSSIKDHFEKTFWPAYPRKVGKKKALDAFKKAFKQTDIQTIMAGLKTYKQTKPPDMAWCHASTWLNGERWNDEPDDDGKHEKNRKRDQSRKSAIDGLLERRYGTDGNIPTDTGGQADNGRDAGTTLPRTADLWEDR